MGLGTNVGERRDNLRRALSLLHEVAHVEATSSVYETDPVGYVDQPHFWNMAARVTTTLSPEDLLQQLIAIEHQMGRERTFRNAPRIIDLDILLYGDVVYDAPGINIPHPRMNERAFVLLPLVELDSGIVDLRSGKRLGEILAAGEFERAEVVGKL